MTTKLHAARVLLSDVTVGWLIHDHSGLNRFVVDENYIALERAPTVSLSFIDPDRNPQRTAALLREFARHPTMNLLPTFFSNMMPEGALREFVAREQGTHLNDEFQFIRILGRDLPGAVRVVDADLQEVPSTAFDAGRRPSAMKLEPTPLTEITFSLAGVQMKFSMSETDTGLTLHDGPGTRIVKTPSPQHEQVPVNEFSMMRLAQAVGVEVPPLRLVEVSRLAGLPRLNLPQEDYAYSIDRFDRDEHGQPIHIEDFAQALALRPNKKYETNHPTIFRFVRDRFPRAMPAIEAMIQRIVVNILVGNTDAHLKNWSIIYRDGRTPELAPAYDIVSTLPYMGRRTLGLNLVRQVDFREINEEIWMRFASKADLPEKLVLSVVKETVSRAESKWPDLLGELPIPGFLAVALKEHWLGLPSLYAGDALARAL